DVAGVGDPGRLTCEPDAAPRPRPHREGRDSRGRSLTPLLTVHERIVPGPVLRAGSSSSYRSLVTAAGERHSVRTELTGPTGPEIRARGEALLAIGHMTDLHVTDVESPARFEFLNRFAGDSRFRELLTMQRPQEALNSHA